VQENKKIYLGIDPGKNGGFAIIYTIDGKVEDVMAKKCGKNAEEMAIDMKVALSCKEYDQIECVLELVHSFPGQGVVSTFSFGENFGKWKGVLAALDVKYNLVRPQEWMKIYDIPKTSKKHRKKHLYDKAAEMFPQLKITYVIADALLIANYCKEKGNGLLKTIRGKKKRKYSRKNTSR
jgi:crossover junction endodeoxyribonuclease RuvC